MIGEKRIGIAEERLSEWRKKTSPSSGQSAATAVSRARLEALAKQFGLMEKTKTNPQLVFLADDIALWEKQHLDETRLVLEFAARRLILEEADRQGVLIPSKQVLAQAALEVIPLLQSQASSVSQNLVCAGDTSEEFVKQSWAGLKSDTAKSLACTDKTIRKWTRQADDQQIMATKADCSNPPSSADLKTYFGSSWALSDVATSWFIRGEAFYQQKKWPEAREAYKTVVDKYHCAFTWDPRGWFWRTADGAQEKYDEIRLK
ncbi:MAG TPA: hypothetical protein VNG71_12195 [Pyrinomonadaceae bacterium]|nr:hypothetical protein [Pyrinomonadaceae bacterium]